MTGFARRAIITTLTPQARTLVRACVCVCVFVKRDDRVHLMFTCETELHASARQTGLVRAKPAPWEPRRAVLLLHLTINWQFTVILVSVTTAAMCISSAVISFSFSFQRLQTGGSTAEETPCFLG